MRHAIAGHSAPDSPIPVLWVQVVRFFPCAVAVLWPVVRLLPVELRDAARVDGARPQQELWHVVLPLALISSALVGLLQPPPATKGAS